VIAFPISRCRDSTASCASSSGRSPAIPSRCSRSTISAILTPHQFAALIRGLRDLLRDAPSWSPATTVAAAAGLWAKLGGSPETPLLLCDGRQENSCPRCSRRAAWASVRAAALRMAGDPARSQTSGSPRPFDSRAPAGGGRGHGCRGRRRARRRQRRSGRADADGGPSWCCRACSSPSFCRQVISPVGKGATTRTAASPAATAPSNVSHLKQTEDYTVVEPIDAEGHLRPAGLPASAPSSPRFFAFRSPVRLRLPCRACPTASRASIFLSAPIATTGAPTTAGPRLRRILESQRTISRGGELVFPEYAGLKVSPPPGAAAVFSCSLLHRALPVTPRPPLRADDFLPGPSRHDRAARPAGVCSCVCWRRAMRQAPAGQGRTWRPARNGAAPAARFGTHNSCDPAGQHPCSWRSGGDQHVVERKRAAGVRGFGPRCGRPICPGGWMFHRLARRATRPNNPVRGGEQDRHF